MPLDSYVIVDSIHYFKCFFWEGQSVLSDQILLMSLASLGCFCKWPMGRGSLFGDAKKAHVSTPNRWQKPHFWKLTAM